MNIRQQINKITFYFQVITSWSNSHFRRYHLWSEHTMFVFSSEQTWLNMWLSGVFWSLNLVSDLFLSCANCAFMVRVVINMKTSEWVKNMQLLIWEKKIIHSHYTIFTIASTIVWNFLRKNIITTILSYRCWTHRLKISAFIDRNIVCTVKERD